MGSPSRVRNSPTIARRWREVGSTAKLTTDLVVEWDVSHRLASLARSMRRTPAPGDDWREIQARYHRGIVYRALLGAVTLCTLGWLLLTRGAPPTQSDIDALALRSPKPVKPFRPIHPVDPRALSSIDMAKVHSRLLPAWIVALQHNPHSIGHRDAERAFRSLREEAGKDLNLALLLDQLHDKVMEARYDLRGQIAALVKGWNDYLARGKVPFRLEHRMTNTVRGPELRVWCYRVVADVPASVGQSQRRVLVLARQDRTNLVEAFLGQTSTEQGVALVVADRIADYAIEKIWPLLQTSGDPLEAELFAKVRGEARLALGTAVVDSLTQAFALRHALESELSALGKRRGCGRGIYIERVPWDGLSLQTLAMVNRVAQKNDSRQCARVTLTDADRLSERSRQLREHADLEQALGALAGWIAKAVVAHEARHLLDRTASGDAPKSDFCKGCPRSFSVRQRAEVSAYLASFEAEGVGYVALLQACGIELDTGGSHSVALKFLLPRLLVDGCSGPIPDNLYARAAALRRQLFGQRVPVAPPERLPAVIPIPRD